MNLSVDHKSFIGKQLLCIKSDKTFGITKGNSYRITDIRDKHDKFFYRLRKFKEAFDKIKFNWDELINNVAEKTLEDTKNRLQSIIFCPYCGEKLKVRKDEKL